MGFGFYDCHAKERGDHCGSPDCRTCHPENFDEMGDYLGATCEVCGEAFWRKYSDDAEDLCAACRETEDELKADE